MGDGWFSFFLLFFLLDLYVGFTIDVGLVVDFWWMIDVFKASSKIFLRVPKFIHFLLFFLNSFLLSTENYLSSKKNTPLVYKTGWMNNTLHTFKNSNYIVPEYYKLTSIYKL